MLFYLATPYSLYSKGLHQAFVDAVILAARLLKQGTMVFSPIAHSHAIATYGNIDPLDHDLWLDFDAHLMAVADALLVANMDGWRESRGVRFEIEHFRKFGKPVFALDCDTLSMRPLENNSI